MKRHKHLWEQVCSFDNVAAAAREALLGKRGKHVGARFFADWEREVVRLGSCGVRRHFATGCSIGGWLWGVFLANSSSP